MRPIVLAALLALGPVAHGAPVDARASVQALRLELSKTQSAVEPLYARRRALQDDVQRLAISIDAVKKRPEGVARDRELQALLAKSKDETDELERVQAQLRWREPGLVALRRRVLVAIDLAEDGKALPEAERLDLERLRVTIVALLASPALPVQVVRDPGAAVNPLDGPRELHEKADLLRDSGDKLRREVKRIAARLDGVERRRHLRERSGALDEDLFGESTSNRRVARVGDSGGAGTAASVGTTGSVVNAPTMSSNGDGAPIAPSHNETTTLRNLVDPATLGELEHADGLDDSERQTRALRKAQAELESLANDLERRATALDGRAAQLKQQK